jgi:D-alanyl-lipoteichoic acid acyltransferase DltB (MBOAT superfamily)
MVLSSSAYFIFLVGVFFLYWPAARFRAISLAVILFANYFFYAKWDLRYLALIPAASTCDFLLGWGLQSSKTPWIRRALVTTSIVMNIGLLATLRYLPASTVALPLTRLRVAQSCRPALADIIGARLAWTVAMISSVSMPCR